MSVVPTAKVPRCRARDETLVRVVVPELFLAPTSSRSYRYSLFHISCHVLSGHTSVSYVTVGAQFALRKSDVTFR